MQIIVMPRSAPDTELRSNLPDVYRIVDALERWHDDEGHYGSVAHCTLRPCRDIASAVDGRWPL